MQTATIRDIFARVEAVQYKIKKIPGVPLVECTKRGDELREVPAGGSYAVTGATVTAVKGPAGGLQEVRADQWIIRCSNGMFMVMDNVVFYNLFYVEGS